MLEVELKSVVDDVTLRRAVVETGGGRLSYAGALLDRRYDTDDRRLAGQDHVFRLRVYRSETETRAELDWKGPTRQENGYKLREELGAGLTDPGVIAQILDRLGYVVTMEIDRDIAQYELQGASVRFERYPRLDDLVEVEGSPEQIERAIAVIGLPRIGFTSDRLPDFVRRFEARTGQRAALSAAALRGDPPFDMSDA